MRFGVSRQTLLLTAGIVWLAAGANILRIGIVTWSADDGTWLAKAGLTTVVFLVFALFVFRRLYFKHSRRIEDKKNDKNCPFGFFDPKGWIVMALMIALGIVMRKYHLLPDGFIAGFYSGLGLALTTTGTLFVRYWWKSRRQRAC